MTCKYHKYKYCPESCYNNRTWCHFASDCHINIENQSTLGQAPSESIADNKLIEKSETGNAPRSDSQEPVSDPIEKMTHGEKGCNFCGSDEVLYAVNSRLLCDKCKGWATLEP